MRTFDPVLTQCGAVLASAIVAVLSWQYGYAPALQADGRDRQQAAVLRQRISKWETVVTAFGGETAWLTHHQQRLDQLRGRFPPQSRLPDLLNTLVETLKANEMKLLDLTQGNLEPVQEAGAPLLLGGTPRYRLPITVTAEGRYHAVRAAIERLTSEGFPVLVGIEQAEFRLKDPVSGKLDVKLQFSLYVTGPATLPAPNA